jgi:hypothetical protein
MGTGILGPEHWAQRWQDDNDGSSVLGSDVASSTASISSTILMYRQIHGRPCRSEQSSAQYWKAFVDPDVQI